MLVSSNSNPSVLTISSPFVSCEYESTVNGFKYPETVKTDAPVLESETGFLNIGGCCITLIHQIKNRAEIRLCLREAVVDKTRKCVAVLIMIGTLIIFFIPPSGGLNREAIRVGALVLFSMGFWATGVLPEYLTALIFMLAGMIFKVAPAPVIFSGFFSGALWLVFGGLVIASAVKSTGFDQRLSGWLAAVPITSYAGIIGGMFLLTMLLSFFIPSTMGRVILLVPLATAMSDRLGLSADTGRKGMVLAATLGSFVPAAAVLPANVPNMVLAGAAETLYDLSFGYGTYLKLHYPVLGVMKGLVTVFLICRLFPDRIRPVSSPQGAATKPLGVSEMVLVVILSGTLLLWGTNFLHGVSPAWVALAAALFCMLPFTGIFPGGVFNQGINFGPFFYVGGVLRIVTLINRTGLGDFFGSRLIDLIGLQPGHDIRNFLSLCLVSTALSPLTTPPGVVAVLAPLSAKISTVTGFPLMTVLMTQVIGFSNVILPYHVPPIVVGLQVGGVSARDAARLTLSLCAASTFILMPINYLWWHWLGVFGP